jgi:hypothetical protein
MLANTGNQKKEKLRTVSQAIAATVRINPIRMARVMRRGAVVAFILDLVN